MTKLLSIAALSFGSLLSRRIKRFSRGFACQNSSAKHRQRTLFQSMNLNGLNARQVMPQWVSDQR
jgi:hypothetical protein